MGRVGFETRRTGVKEFGELPSRYTGFISGGSFGGTLLGNSVLMAERCDLFGLRLRLGISMTIAAILAML